MSGETVMAMKADAEQQPEHRLAHALAEGRQGDGRCPWATHTATCEEQDKGVGQQLDLQNQPRKHSRSTSRCRLR